MANYDYIVGKKRIQGILDNSLDVIEQGKIPKDENFTFSNAYYGWVTGVFIDIRNSTELFNKEDKVLVSKVIRSFTSEIIEILRQDDNLREIGIRGDCVYAIYTTPQQDDIYEVTDKIFYVNTFLRMLNKLFVHKSFPSIQVGIGISTAEELVVKAGRKDVGINNSVWIGDAVTKASNLSSFGNKESYKTIVMSNCTYSNIIKKLIENNSTKDVESWFSNFVDDDGLGIFYSADIINLEFNDWILNGMHEN